jgi:hypothetical protein
MCGELGALSISRTLGLSCTVSADRVRQELGSEEANDNVVARLAIPRPMTCLEIVAKKALSAGGYLQVLLSHD